MFLRLPSFKSFLTYIRQIVRICSKFWYAWDEKVAETQDILIGRLSALFNRKQVNKGIAEVLHHIQAANVPGLHYKKAKKKKETQVNRYFRAVWKDAKREFPALNEAVQTIIWVIKADHGYQFRAAVSSVLVFVMVFSPILPSIDPIKLWGALSSKASVKTWDGGGADNNWSTAANWSDDIVPTADDIATFDETSDHDVVIDTDVSVAGLDIRSEYPSKIEVRSGKRITIGLEGFRQDGGTFESGPSPMEVLGSFTLLGGKFIATSGTLSVKRNLALIAGEFEHNNGTVSLNGIGQLVSGTATFNNLSKIAQVGQTLTIQSGSTLTVKGTLSLKGGAPVVAGVGTENLLTVAASSSGEPAMLDPRGATDLQYVLFEDILNVSPKKVTCDDYCYESGGTSGWNDFAEMTAAVALPEPEPVTLELDLDPAESAESALNKANETLAENGITLPEVSIGRLLPPLSTVNQDTDSNDEAEETDEAAKAEESDIRLVAEELVQFNANEPVQFHLETDKEAKKVKLTPQDPEKAGETQEFKVEVEETEDTENPDGWLEWGLDLVSSIVGSEAQAAYEETAAETIMGAVVLDPEGEETNIRPILLNNEDGETVIEVPKPEQDFRPGKYTLRVQLTDAINENEAVTFEQDFTWGVLAMNLDKSTYKSGETAEIGIGVLDDWGHTVCDADVTLEITSPSGAKTVLETAEIKEESEEGEVEEAEGEEQEEEQTEETEEAGITRSESCSRVSVTDEPDYKAAYTTAENGQYMVVVTAVNENGARTMAQSFEVTESAPFVVERTAATRIYPVEDYTVAIKVTAAEDFNGTVTEQIPADFVINGGLNDLMNAVGGPDEEAEEEMTAAVEAAQEEATEEVEEVEEATDTEDTEGVEEIDSSISPSPSIEPTPETQIEEEVIEEEEEEADTEDTEEVEEVEKTVETVETIGNEEPIISVQENQITWTNVAIKAGESTTLSYTFNAPDKSPEFYLLGELTVGDWTEPRAWQLASDAVVTWDGGGSTNNWSEAANWTNDTAPTSSDIATFDSTSTKDVTINANINVAGIDINSGYTGTITQDTSYTITIGTSGWDQADGTFTGGSGAITISTTFALTLGTFTSTSGILTIIGQDDGKDDFTHTSGTGTFNHNNGTVAFTGNRQYVNVATTETFYNLTVNTMDNTRWVNLSGDSLVVNNLFTFTQGTIYNGTINAKGAISIASTSGGGSTGVLKIDGSGDQSFEVPDGAILPMVYLDNSTTTISFADSANVSIEGLNLQNGTVTSTTGTLTFIGTDQGSGSNDGFTHTSGTGTFNHNNGTVAFTGNRQYVNVATTETFYNLTVNTMDNTRWVNLSGDSIVIANTLTLTNGYVNTGTIQAQGDVTVDSGFDGGTALLQFTGTNDQTYTDAGGNEPNGDITINKTGGTVTLASSADWNATSQDVTLTAGTLDLAGNALSTNVLTVTDTLKMQGSESVTRSTLDLQSGSTVQFYGDGTGSTHTITDFSTEYKNVVISDSAGLDTFQLGAAADVNEEFQLQSGTFAQSDYTLNAAGDFTISNGATFTKSTNGSQLTFDGDLTFTDEGTTKQDMGDVAIGTSPDTTDLASDMVATSVTVNTGDVLNTNGYDLDITNDITVIGTLDATDDGEGDLTMINLGGDWSNTGTFTYADSTVTFDGGDQAVNGNTTWYNFTKTDDVNDDTDETLTFEAEKTQTIASGGVFTITGIDDSDRVNLRSSVTDTAWIIDIDGTPIASYHSISKADVKDSNNVSGANIVACEVYDSGGNTAWTIWQLCAVSGVVYTDEGTTNIGANKTVAVAVNGTKHGTTDETDESGAFAIADLTVYSNDILTIYLDDEPENGVTVSVTDGVNITDLNVYENRLIARHDNYGSITNTQLDTADTSAGSNDSDVTGMYTVESGTLQMYGDFNDGLIGYWKFDEGTGTSTADSSGSGNTGTLTNGTTWTTTVPDEINFTNPYALDFDGSNDYVSIGNQNIPTNGSFTLSAWVKIDVDTTDGSVIGHRGTAADGTSVLLWFDNDDTNGDAFQFAVSSDNPKTGDGYRSIVKDTWYHVTAIYDDSSATQRQLYVDGALRESDAGDVSFDKGTTAWGVGSENGSASVRPFNGQIDDVQVYNRALSADEIATLAGGDKNNELFIPENYSMTPGGTIDVADVDINGTLNLEANTAYVAGSWDATGGSVTTTGRVVMNGTGAETITSDGESFNDLYINDGLVGYWKFDEGTGTTINDSSGYGNTGTLTNSDGDEWTTTVPSGLDFDSPYALDFDGTNDYVEFASPVFDSHQAFSLSFWYYPSDQTRYDSILLANTSSGSTAIKVGVYDESSGELVFRWFSSSTLLYDRTGSSDFSLNTWQNVVLTYNGNFTSSSSHNFYVNSVNVDSGGYQQAGSGTPLVPDGIWKLGGSSSQHMTLDDVRIYNRALSAEEIARLASGSMPRTGTGTYTLADSLDVNGSLILSSGTLDVSSSNYGVDVANDWENDGGEFTAQSGTVTLSGASTGYEIQTGGEPFNNLTVADGSRTLADHLYADETVAQTAGTLDTDSSHNWNIYAGLLETAGTFTPNSSKVTVDDTDNHTFGIDESLYDVSFGDSLKYGLVGYWKLDEGTGTSAADSSGNGNTGTLTNGPTWTNSSLPVTNYTNSYALDFDGTDDYVPLASTSTFTGDVSLCAWIYRDNSSALHGVWGGNAGVGGEQVYRFEANSTTFTVRTSVDVIRTYSLPNSAAAWQYLCITRNTNNVRVYLNNTESSTGAISDSGTITIQRFGTSHTASWFNGKIDEVRIYNRALSTEEMRHLYMGAMKHTPDATGTYTAGNSLDINNDLMIADGSLDISTYNMNVAGDWYNEGTYVPQNSTVTFDGTDQTVYGTSSFYNFTKNDAVADSTDREMEFEAGKTQTVTNTFYVHGSGIYDRVNISSTEDGTQWTLDLDNTGSGNVEYAEVRDTAIANGSITSCDGLVIAPNDNNTNWTISGIELTQNDWRWYVDNSLQTPTDPWGNPNLDENELMSVLPASNDTAQKGDELRARVNLEVTGACALLPEQVAFKVQYSEAGTGGSCTDSGLTWTDVDDTGTSEIWRYGTDASLTDGDALTSSLISTTTVKENYVSSKASPQNNPNGASAGDDIEYDFHLEHNGATGAKTYCFRVVETDGTVLSTYNADGYMKLETRPTTDQVMRHGEFFMDETEKGFLWAD